MKLTTNRKIELLPAKVKDLATEAWNHYQRLENQSPGCPGSVAWKARYELLWSMYKDAGRLLSSLTLGYVPAPAERLNHTVEVNDEPKQ